MRLQGHTAGTLVCPLVPCICHPGNWAHGGQYTSGFQVYSATVAPLVPRACNSCLRSLTRWVSVCPLGLGFPPGSARGTPGSLPPEPPWPSPITGPAVSQESKLRQGLQPTKRGQIPPLPQFPCVLFPTSRCQPEQVWRDWWVGALCRPELAEGPQSCQPPRVMLPHSSCEGSAPVP